MLNEGLKTLGLDGNADNKSEVNTYDENYHYGVFANSGIEDVHLPSTLKSLIRGTFMGCRSLKEIHLVQGLEHIGE